MTGKYLNRLLLSSLIGITVLSGLSAKEHDEKKTDLNTKFYFKTDQDRAVSEYFALGAELELHFDVSDQWELEMEVDAATDKIQLEEIWGKVKLAPASVKFGMFENDLTLDDRLSSTEYLFSTDSIIRKRLEYMGWYSPAATGVLARRNYKDGELPFSGYAHVMFQPSGREVQADLGLYYPYGGEDTWLGISGAYYPFFIHSNWIGSDNSYTQDHNFLIQAAVADFSDEALFIYKGDITLGNNLIDPVGFIHYPGEEGVSWFLGSDLFAGLPLISGDFVWTPALNASFLIHDLSTPEAWSSSIRMGSRLAWNEMFFIHVDTGLEIDTRYDSDADQNQKLVTGLEVLWGIKIQVRL